MCWTKIANGPERHHLQENIHRCLIGKKNFNIWYMHIKKDILRFINHRPTYDMWAFLYPVVSTCYNHMSGLLESQNSKQLAQISFLLVLYCNKCQWRQVNCILTVIPFKSGFQFQRKQTALLASSMGLKVLAWIMSAHGLSIFDYSLLGSRMLREKGILRLTNCCERFMKLFFFAKFNTYTILYYVCCVSFLLAHSNMQAVAISSVTVIKLILTFAFKNKSTCIWGAQVQMRWHVDFFYYLSLVFVTWLRE